MSELARRRRVVPRRRFVPRRIYKHRLTSKQRDLIRSKLKEINFKDPLDEIFLIDLYQQFLEDFKSIPRLAKDYRMPESRVKRYLQKLGVLDRLEFRKKSIMNSYARSKSIVYTAKRFNVSPWSLRKALKEWEVDVLTRKESRHYKVLQHKDKIIEMYMKEEVSATEIARRLGLAEATILNNLKRWGIKMRSYQRIFTKDLKRMYDQGMKPKDIAMKLNTSLSYVRKRLVESGVVFRRPFEEPEVKERLNQLYRQGASIEQLSKLYNAGSTQIRERITHIGKQGVPGEKERKIVELFLTGQYDAQSIGDQLLVSPRLVGMVLSKYGFYGYARRYTKADKKRIAAQVIKLRRAGLSYEKIGRSLNLGSGFLQKLQRDFGIKVPSRRSPLSKEGEEALVKHFKSSPMTFREAGRKFGITSPQSRHIIAEKHGVKSVWRKGSRYSPQETAKQNEIIERLYKRGISLKKIARKVDLDHTTVKGRLVLMGLYRKKIGGFGGHQYFPEVWEKRKFRMLKDLFRGKTISYISEKYNTTHRLVNAVKSEPFELNDLVLINLDRRTGIIGQKPFMTYDAAKRHAMWFIARKNRYEVNLILKPVGELPKPIPRVKPVKVAPPVLPDATVLKRITKKGPLEKEIENELLIKSLGIVGGRLIEKRAAIELFEPDKVDTATIELLIKEGQTNEQISSQLMVKPASVAKIRKGMRRKR